jgi:hypothetical protein
LPGDGSAPTYEDEHRTLSHRGAAGLTGGVRGASLYEPRDMQRRVLGNDHQECRSSTVRLTTTLEPVARQLTRQGALRMRAFYHDRGGT